MKKLILAGIAIVMTLAACKKYDEGPMLSLRSKKERVANEWKLDKYLVNGTEQSLGGIVLTITMEKDGKFSNSFGSTGTWEFIEKKEQIKMTYTGGSSDTLTIVRLKEKEFWYYEMSGNTKNESHLIPK